MGALYRSTACRAYSEQEGWNLHDGGNSGDRKSLYSRMGAASRAFVSRIVLAFRRRAALPAGRTGEGALEQVAECRIAEALDSRPRDDDHIRFGREMGLFAKGGLQTAPNAVADRSLADAAGDGNSRAPLSGRTRVREELEVARAVRGRAGANPVEVSSLELGHGDPLKRLRPLPPGA